MRKVKYLIIFALIFTSIFLVRAEYSLNFSGYINDIPVLQILPVNSTILGNLIDSRDFFINLSRLRLTPTFELWEDARLEFHYEIDAIYSKILNPFFGTTGMTNRQAISLNWSLFNECNLNVRHFIDRLYFKQTFENTEFVIGRQRISWGVGRIWQPTDLFNPINPANFSKYEKDGADAISGKIFLGNFTDLELVLNFREKLNETNYGGRFRTNIEKFDFSAMTGKFDRQIVIGGDFAGNLFDAGVRGEVIFSMNKDYLDSNFIRFILGIDYQFSSKLYALLEYQYNGEGQTCRDCYEIERLVKGEILNLSQNYITTQIRYLIHPLVSINAGAMWNMNDKSGYSNLVADWSALDNINITLGFMIPWGSEKSEFWYYPTSIYISGQFFF